MPKIEKKAVRKKNAVRPQPCTVICRFTVKPAGEKDFLKVLSRDWPNLLRLGLATKDEPAIYRHVDETGGPVYFQIMSWASEESAKSAHTNEEVLKIWMSFEALTEARAGHAACEFPHVEMVPMNWVRPSAFLR